MSCFKVRRENGDAREGELLLGLDGEPGPAVAAHGLQLARPRHDVQGVAERVVPRGHARLERRERRPGAGTLQAREPRVDRVVRRHRAPHTRAPVAPKKNEEKKLFF